MDEKTQWLNHYACTNCNRQWSELRNANIDTDCPTCEYVVPPYNSIPITQQERAQ